MLDSLYFLRLTGLCFVSYKKQGIRYDPNENSVKDGLNRLKFSYDCLNLMQTAKTVSGAPKALFTRGSDGEKLSAKAGANGFEYSVFLIYTYHSGILDFAQAVGRFSRQA